MINNRDHLAYLIELINKISVCPELVPAESVGVKFPPRNPSATLDLQTCIVVDEKIIKVDEYYKLTVIDNSIVFIDDNLENVGVDFDFNKLNLAGVFKIGDRTCTAASEVTYFDYYADELIPIIEMIGDPRGINKHIESGTSYNNYCMMNGLIELIKRKFPEFNIAGNSNDVQYLMGKMNHYFLAVQYVYFRLFEPGLFNRSPETKENLYWRHNDMESVLMFYSALQIHVTLVSLASDGKNYQGVFANGDPLDKRFKHHVILVNSYGAHYSFVRADEQKTIEIAKICYKIIVNSKRVSFKFTLSSILPNPYDLKKIVKKAFECFNTHICPSETPSQVHFNYEYWKWDFSLFRNFPCSGFIEFSDEFNDIQLSEYALYRYHFNCTESNLEHRFMSEAPDIYNLIGDFYSQYASFYLIHNILLHAYSEGKLPNGVLIGNFLEFAIAILNKIDETCEAKEYRKYTKSSRIAAYLNTLNHIKMINDDDIQTATALYQDLLSSVLKLKKISPQRQ